MHKDKPTTMIQIRYVINPRTWITYRKGSPSKSPQMSVVFDGKLVARMDNIAVGYLNYILKKPNHGLGIFGNYEDYNDVDYNDLDVGESSDESETDDTCSMQRPICFTWSSDGCSFSFQKKKFNYIESTVNGERLLLYFKFLNVVMYYWGFLKKRAVKKMRHIFSAIDDVDVFLGTKPFPNRFDDDDDDVKHEEGNDKQASKKDAPSLETVAFLNFVKQARAHDTLTFKSFGDCLQIVDNGCKQCFCKDRVPFETCTLDNDVDIDVRLYCRRNMFVGDSKVRVQTTDTKPWWKIFGLEHGTLEDVQSMLLQDETECLKWLEAAEAYADDTLFMSDDVLKAEFLELHFSGTFFGIPSSDSFCVLASRDKQSTIDTHFLSCKKRKHVDVE